jgi:hypothetical protein
VEGCGCCSDLVTVAGAVRESADAATAEIRVPDAAAVWQRAQWAARQDAARAAARPVAAAQTIAAAGVVAVLVGAVIWLGGLLPEWPDLTGASENAFAGWLGVKSAAESAWTLVADRVVMTRLPPGLGWILSGAVGAGLLLVALALGVSKLADSPSDSPAHR